MSQPVNNTPAQLQWQPFSSAVDVSFWSTLGRLKLDSYQLDNSRRSIVGGFSNSQHTQVPSQLCLGSYSFDAAVSAGNAASSTAALPAASPFPMYGTLYNANTMEEFKSMNVTSLLDNLKEDIWNRLVAYLKDDVPSSSDSYTSILSRFLLLTFADLKNHKYSYWFCFPALTFDALKLCSHPTNAAPVKVTTLGSEKGSRAFVEAFAKSNRESGNHSIYSLVIHDVAAESFVVQLLTPTLLRQHARDLFQSSGNTSASVKYYVSFVDPCPLAGNMGWPGRNLLTLVYLTTGLTGNIDVISFRDVELAARDTSSLNPAHVSSLIFSARIESSATSPSELLSNSTPKVVGWEKNAAGKSSPRIMDLGALMDPLRLAESSVDLNLKLMRWRALPALDMEKLATTKCLLLGAGTLGCNVSRALLGWGVRHITLVDNGKVSYSNPVRQSLFEFEDCKSGGKPKALAAAEALKRIYPRVEATGINLSIPMPGHAVPPSETDEVLGDIRRLQQLIEEHDAVFLLTDSRESRWLPTVMCAASHKLCINTALGFDTYVVMRHGDNFGSARTDALAKALQTPAAASSSSSSSATSSTSAPSSSAATSKLVDPHGSLGCYFCNDVVAPTDSLSDRTLDQQCTVTRPGLAFISSAMAVELFVTLLHHPLKQYAPADLDKGSGASETSGNSGFGLVPHQLRGFLTRFNTTLVLGQAFDRCTACSAAIIQAYLAEKEQFVLRVLNASSSRFLEDLSGLTQMKAETEAMFAQMDIDAEGEDEFEADDF